MRENAQKQKKEIISYKVSVHLKTSKNQYVAAHKLLQIGVTVMYYKIISMDSHETWAPAVGEESNVGAAQARVQGRPPPPRN